MGRRMTRPAPAPLRWIDILRDGLSVREEQKAMIDNGVCTSKYTLRTFLPRSLFEQFRRIGNVYFLAMCTLALFVSPLAPFSTLIALILVLGVGMIKDAAEDRKRHRSDNRVRQASYCRE